MARPNRSKTQKAKKKSRRRPAARAGKKSDRKAARMLDQVVRDFDGAVDRVQNSLEQLREMLPKLVALEVRRDRLRRIKELADEGILDALQGLATALENCDVAG